jgi:hypothetical protein
MNLAHSLSEEFESIRASAISYFENALEVWRKEREHPKVMSWGETTEFFKNLPEPILRELTTLEDRIASWGAEFASTARSYPLLNAADVGEIRVNTRKLMAALRFREYAFREVSLMSWEDQAYGVQPAENFEREIFPEEPTRIFWTACEKLEYLLKLMKGTADAPNDVRPNGQVHSAVRPQKSDTAFMMMWMSEDHPELVDVKLAITDVFKEFGITAIRADDIEHDGVITDRILSEIASAEFLIADLTGARPNVYYEVGYAHALGKRVILYRKKDSELHFDLAGRNVPAYANLTDLKQKLRTRLEAMLGLESPVTKEQRQHR